MARVSIITKKVHKGTEKYWKVWTSKKYKSRSYHPIIASVDTPLRRRGINQSIIAVEEGLPRLTLEQRGVHGSSTLCVYMQQASRTNNGEYMGAQLFVKYIFL